MATFFGSHVYAQTVVSDRSDSFEITQKLGNGLVFGSNMWKYDNECDYDPIDFQLAKQYGFDHVRINARMQNMQSSPGTLTSSAMNDLITTIDAALAEDLMVVICPFFWWGHADTDPRGAPVYANEYADDLGLMWEQIAARCAAEEYGLDEVIFELYEEPANVDVELMIAECVTAITGVENRYIIIPGDGFITIEGMGRVFENDQIPLDYDRLIGTFHFYEPKCLFTNVFHGTCVPPIPQEDAVWPTLENDEDTLEGFFTALDQKNRDWATANGTVPIPIYMGEYGTRNKPSMGSEPGRYDLDREERKHWVWWTRTVAEKYGYATAYWNAYGEPSFGLGNNDFDFPENRTLVDPDPDPGEDNGEEFIRQAIRGRYQAEDPNSVTAATLSSLAPIGTGANSEDGYLSFLGAVAGSGSLINFNDVYVGKTDTYNVTIRFSNPDAVHLNLDIRSLDAGGTVNTSLFDVPFAPTGEGNWYSKTLQMDMTAGINRVRLFPTEVGGDLRIDYIAVTQVNKVYDSPHYSNVAADNRSGSDASYFAIPTSADVHAYAASPDTNFGASSALQVRQAGNWAREAYVKFDVPALNDVIESAVLKVYSETEDDWINVLGVDSSWTETGLTWNNRPTTGTYLGNANAASEQWFEVDVTAHVTGQGEFAFLLREQGDTKHDLGSKEGLRGAYLEVRTRKQPDTFSAYADVHAFAASPDANFGSSSTLAVRQLGGWAREAYVKIDIEDVFTPIQSVVLVVYSETEVNWVNALGIVNGWSEDALTWNNRPTTGQFAGSALASPGQWFEIDVTSLVPGNGTYSFLLREQGDSKHDLGSKDGGNAAYLEVRYY